jgi:hypothetical protein
LFGVFDRIVIRELIDFCLFAHHNQHVLFHQSADYFNVVLTKKRSHFALL